MAFFGGDKVSYKEFKRAIYKLRLKGFSQIERDEVENVFRGDLHESGTSAGISSEEIRKGVSYLKEHSENHHLSHEHIAKLEEVLRHYL